MSHYKLPILEEKGFVVLKNFGKPVPADEYRHMEYVDWKSGGDTNFAPIASAFGDMECAGFWDHGKSDKDGIWTKNAEVCPTLVSWTEVVGDPAPEQLDEVVPARAVPEEPFARVVGVASTEHHERPVARLHEHRFARELREGCSTSGACVAELVEEPDGVGFDLAERLPHLVGFGGDP